MASLSREVRRGRTLYRIQWLDQDKRRRSIRLSGVSKKGAEGIRAKTEALVSCRISGEPMAADLASWVAELGEDLHSQTGGRWSAGAQAVGAAMDPRNVHRRLHRRPGGCRRPNAYELEIDSPQADRLLRRGARVVQRLREGDAFDWRQHIAKAYASATLANHVKFAKHFFRYAVRKRIIKTNPFAEIRGGARTTATARPLSAMRPSRRPLQACPDAQWRLILALCRFGGLRCPSEVLWLRWGDIDWEGKRFSVTSAEDS